jgi:hypothetical protein
MPFDRADWAYPTEQHVLELSRPAPLPARGLCEPSVPPPPDYLPERYGQLTPVCDRRA